MELIITEKPPSVCLNMIVKNESHIIIETLEMLLETATRKDKKEIKEAIEVLQMLLDTYEY